MLEIACASIFLLPPGLLVLGERFGHVEAEKNESRRVSTGKLRELSSS